MKRNGDKSWSGPLAGPRCHVGKSVLDKDEVLDEDDEDGSVVNLNI